jgi:hypothetical protein
LHGLAAIIMYCLTRWADGLAVGGLAGLSLVGGPGGLAVLRNITAADGGLPHNWVNAVVADGPRLLIGTYAGRGGLGGRRTGPSGAGNGRDIGQSGAGLQVGNVTLFGTLSNGLLVGRSNRGWSVFREALPSLNVTALAGDERGLWVGTDRGLAFLPWEQLMQALDR